MTCDDKAPYGIKCEEPAELALNLYDMRACLVTWQNGEKFYRFHSGQYHHDASRGFIDGPMGQHTVDAIRNTFDYLRKNA